MPNEPKPMVLRAFNDRVEYMNTICVCLCPRLCEWVCVMNILWPIYGRTTFSTCYATHSIFMNAADTLICGSAFFRTQFSVWNVDWLVSINSKEIKRNVHKFYFSFPSIMCVNVLVFIDFLAYISIIKIDWWGAKKENKLHKDSNKSDKLIATP